MARLSRLAWVVGRKAFLLMFDSLADLLIQIQLLREEQWKAIRSQLAADADLDAFLDSVQKLSAWWAVGGPLPALTVHQREWIKYFFERDRLARLKGALRRGDYLILQKLGEGAMGIVYKAWDFQEGRLVAIKQIKQVSLETYRRFRREARIQKRLSHPCVVRFLKLARVRKETLLVQEYIDGRTITKEVQARGPIPWQEAVRWILDVLSALELAHRLKIVHRDLKPHNIILYQHPSGVRAKLLDMGLAKCLDPTLMTQTTTKDALTVGDALLGTFEYMAPEQWRGTGDIVFSSDIYSLGCTLFYMLTGGRPPFVANSMMAYCNAHTNNPPPRLTNSQPPISEALDALVQQMLSKAADQRGSPTRLIKQFSRLLRLQAPATHAEYSRQHLPIGSAPVHAPHSERPMSRLPSGTRTADDRFMPFAPASGVNVSGLRSFLRAFLVSQGLFARSLFLLLLVLAVVGMLWIWLRT